jgi:arginine transport system substrate-binding protein
MTLKKILFILVLGISSGTYAETIKFAVVTSDLPITTSDITQKLRAFDLDIAKALCAKINAQCTFSTDKISNMIPSLLSGKYDAWIGAINIIPEREQQIAFSVSYYSSTAKLLATKATTFNAAPIEIKGKTIGVEADTSFILYLKKTYGDLIKIQVFPSLNAAWVALENGKVDAIIEDKILLKRWRAQHPHSKKRYRLISLPQKYLNLIQQKYGIAIAKDKPSLVKAINQAIAALKADGTYNKIVKAHFS